MLAIARFSGMVLAAGLLVAPTLVMAQSSSEVCVIPPDDMVAWWSGDDTTSDMFGGNDADLYLGTMGNTDTAAAYVPGVVGSAWHFDGVDDKAVVANDSSLNPGLDSFTVELWLRGDGERGYSHSLIKNEWDPVAPSRWSISISNDIGFYVIQDGQGGLARIIGDTDINDGAWHHVAMVIDRESQQLQAYVDGFPDNPLAWPDISNLGAIEPEVSLIMGLGFTGELDEMNIYHRCLPEAEVLAIAAAASAGKCKVELDVDIKPGSADNPINLVSEGMVPVAVLSHADFDAATLDPQTAVFGPNGASAIHDAWHLDDVDLDGDMDLVLHFETQAVGFESGAGEACVRAFTLDGGTVGGCDYYYLVN
jgi:hypothetical protein